MRELLAAALLVPSAALGSGYSLPSVVPRDLAMAGSLVASQDSAAAAYENPASLSRLSGLDVSLSGAILGNGSTWTTTTGIFPSPASTELQPAFPAAGYVSWSGTLGDRGWGVGAGVSVPGGGNVAWPEGWAGRHEIQSVDQKVFGAYLTAGVEVIPEIRVGGGLVYYHTTEKLTVYQRIPGPPGATDGLVTVGDAGGAVSFDLSADVQPLRGFPLRFGVDYKHQALQRLEGNVNFAFPPPLQPLYPNQKVTHVLPFPNVLNVGVSWWVIPELQVTLAWTLDRYSVYGSDTFTGQTIDPTTGRPVSISVPRNYGNGSVFRLGVAWRALPGLELRAGGLYDRSGVDAAVFDPSLPDASVWAISGGVGYDFAGWISASAGFFHAWYDTLVSTNPSFPGSYDGYAWIASVGLRFSWDPAAKR